MAEIIANLINRRPDYNIVFFAKSAEENNISPITQLSDSYASALILTNPPNRKPACSNYKTWKIN
jgi:hypothetical protein